MKYLKRFDWKLFFAVLATMFIPTVYQTVRVYFLGDFPSDGGINIASQLQWVNLLYEIVQEAMILPLFFLLGQVINNIKEFSNRVKTGLVVTGCVYGILSIVLFIFVEPMLLFMRQDVALITFDTKKIFEIKQAEERRNFESASPHLKVGAC